MFPMFVDGKRVMVLSYKPKIEDTIKDDATDRWYRVQQIVGRKVQARNASDPRR
ncbi:MULTISPECIES: hypothetical protein [unclassified Brevibacillus]|uniref:hypothetical protein n=1 Tax=unclassified Brevibacillus TaxID=2684853 RepID=UPI003568C2D4